jgi:hypothetical protein
MPGKILDPFGQRDCESEVNELQKLYLYDTPFNEAAIQPETYLIVGRRGSGKTALAQYFSFQSEIPDTLYIPADEPDLYQHVLSELASHAPDSAGMAVPQLRRLWEYILWRIILENPRVAFGAAPVSSLGNRSTFAVSSLINSIFDSILRGLREPSAKGMIEHLGKLWDDGSIDKAKMQALRIARSTPIVVVLDTVEKYDKTNTPLMNAMAALIECAAKFNAAYSSEGIHLKVFVSGELFPHLIEAVLENPGKSVKHPVHLFWRSKDLVRLISWRFFRYLEGRNLLHPESKGEIDWADHKEVLARMWTPYFGQHITNTRGVIERTFPYVLRHTQMRPRQLIWICNAIAQEAIVARRFPQFSEQDIRVGVRESEIDLANEIINSFGSIYHNVHLIVDALMNMPMLFRGNDLDKRAPQTKKEWPPSSYSQPSFRQLVVDLGIVGRVRKPVAGSRYIDAEFQYARRERIPITSHDECVMHPMFYSRFNVQFDSTSRQLVFPFATDRLEHFDDDELY